VTAAASAAAAAAVDGNAAAMGDPAVDNDARGKYETTPVESCKQGLGCRHCSVKSSVCKLYAVCRICLVVVGGHKPVAAAAAAAAATAPPAGAAATGVVVPRYVQCAQRSAVTHTVISGAVVAQ
jgi:ribosomal protein S14